MWSKPQVASKYTKIRIRHQNLLTAVSLAIVSLYSFYFHYEKPDSRDDINKIYAIEFQVEKDKTAT